MSFTKLLAATLLTIVAGFASAQGPVPAAPTKPLTEDAAKTPSMSSEPSAAKALTKEDIDAWLDGYMPYALATGDIAGAVVTVVKDGQIVTERGFGYADVATKKPVDPKLTLFRVGSVSKLVTWTAVMQMVEAGKIDLDADVNKYLDFTIPARDGKPITMRNLMQHVAGFEEQIKNHHHRRSERAGFRHAAQTLDADARLRCGHDASVFELRRIAGRLHRAARVRRIVLRLCREAHLRASST